MEIRNGEPGWDVDFGQHSVITLTESYGEDEDGDGSGEAAKPVALNAHGRARLRRLSRSQSLSHEDGNREGGSSDGVLLLCMKEEELQ